MEYEYWAPCPHGIETLCGNELKAMGIPRVRPLRGGVAFHGTLEQGYRVCLWSRTASRVLLVLGRVDAADADALYLSIHDIPWEDHLKASGTLAVEAGGTNENLRNTQFTGVRTKDAICDRLRELSGQRPNVDTHHPDIRVNIALRGTKATVSLNLAGEALSRRGYHAMTGKVGGRTRGEAVASLRENIAAGMLLAADWPAIAARGGCFVDPLCGSGTLGVEAAMMATDRAPGILRSRWGFDGWLGHDQDAWDSLLLEADERAEAGSGKLPPMLVCDPDPNAVALAAAAARKAGFPDGLEPQVAPIARLEAPAGPTGLVATNPPYSGALTSQSQLPALYASLASRLRAGFSGYELAVLSPDTQVSAGLGMQPHRTVSLTNGANDELLSVFTVGNGDGLAASANTAPTPAGDEPTQASNGKARAGKVTQAYADPHSDQFAARLKKRYAVLRKWAKRERVSCYRVYDADLPDYAVAIDLYNGAGPDEGKRWVHVAEYAAPKEIEPVAASRRLADVLAVCATTFQVTPEEVFLKVRKREKGGSQYSAPGGARSTGGSSVKGIIEEDALKFEINLTDYLDTGIFLDHRLTRELVFEKADRVRFLNLFAYTGTASVHAAAGGAFQTTTVDMSQTYLDWAKRNMALNGFTGEEHEFMRADCLQWVRDMRHDRLRWDLIFVDVPTFSTGAKMGERTWDVQRDHAEFLIDVSRLLTRKGTAIFSCNLRNFHPDEDTLATAGVELEDITESTIPEDYQRNQRIHHCYLMRRVR